MNQIWIGNKCHPDPRTLYNLFITIAKPFKLVGAKCINLCVIALPEGSNGMQRFERICSLRAKQVAPLISQFHDIPHVGDGLSRQ